MIERKIVEIKIIKEKPEMGGEYFDTKSTVEAGQSLPSPVKTGNIKPDSYGPKQANGSYIKWCSEC